MQNTNNKFTRRNFLTVIASYIWGFILAGCKFFRTADPNPTANKTAIPTDTSNPEPANTSSDNPDQEPSSTPEPDLDDLAYFVNLFGFNYFVPLEDLEIHLILSNLNIPASAKDQLNQRYHNLFGNESLQQGSFYPLPVFDQDNQLSIPGVDLLPIVTTNSDGSTEVEGLSIPVYELSENEYTAEVQLTTEAIPLISTLHYSLHYYDPVTEELCDVYLDYEQEMTVLNTGLLNIEMLNIQDMEELTTFPPSELEKRIRQLYSWRQEVIAYGYTELAFVFDELDIIVPLILDKQVKPTEKSSSAGGSSPTPTPGGGPTVSGVSSTSGTDG